jgi:hypothetical protein
MIFGHELLSTHASGTPAAACRTSVTSVAAPCVGQRGHWGQGVAGSNPVVPAGKAPGRKAWGFVLSGPATAGAMSPSGHGLPANPLQIRAATPGRLVVLVGLSDDSASPTEHAGATQVLRDHCRFALVPAFRGHDPVVRDGLELGLDLLDDRPAAWQPDLTDLRQIGRGWPSSSATRHRPRDGPPTTWRGLPASRTITWSGRAAARDLATRPSRRSTARYSAAAPGMRAPRRQLRPLLGHTSVG